MYFVFVKVAEFIPVLCYGRDFPPLVITGLGIRLVPHIQQEHGKYECTSSIPLVSFYHGYLGEPG